MTCPFVQPNIYNPFTVAWLPTQCNSTPLMIFLFFMDIHFRWFQEGRRMDRGIQDAACAAQWWETLETSGERDTAKLSTDTTTSWGKSWRGSGGGRRGRKVEWMKAALEGSKDGGDTQRQDEGWGEETKGGGHEEMKELRRTGLRVHARTLSPVACVVKVIAEFASEGEMKV